MSLGVQTGQEMVLEDISPKDAYDLWKDFFKEYGKVKRNKKAKEYYSTGVKIHQIYIRSNIDVYTKFEERGSNTTMTLWVDLGMAFVNAKDFPKEYQGTIELMDDFRISVKKHVINEELKDQEDALEKIKKSLAKLERENEKLHDKIVDYEQKIVEAREDIEKNLVDQDQKRMEIDAQLEVLKAIQERLKNIK
jgi:hypothetical protein